MRLTLRTLLAYLDDVLEPAQTKLIGQKIQESAVAGKLVSLIRLVVRQRRLKAPSVSGPNIGIDPNVVAQYLDNTLAPEQVVEVEKVLLTSDELLAEVASCHQVMAMVMGKATEVSEASRERLYALGPVTQSEQLRVEEPSGATSSESAVASAAARESERIADAPPSKPVPAEIPEYLRQSSWSQRIFPAAIVALLCIVCLGLLISDPALRGIGLPKADRDAGKNGSENGDSGISASPKADAVPGAMQNQMTLSSIAPAKPPETAINVPSPSLPADPAPLRDAPEGTGKKPAADVAADAALVANRSTPPLTATVPANTVPANTVPAGVEPKPILNPALIQYTSNDGVVLRLDDRQQQWFLVPKRSVIGLGERLVILEPFEAALDIDRGAILATLTGDTSLRLLPADRVTSWGMDVRRGRILLRAGRKDALQSSAISIVVGNDLWKLEFLSADTVCAIEVAPREPVHFEKSLGQNWYVGVLRVLSGSVKWTDADGRSQQVASETAMEITPQDPAQAIQPSPVSSALAPPDWTDPAKRKQHRLPLNSAAFEKNFDLDQPVEMTLLSLLDHRQAKIVELAVRGLALTESIAGMVQALAQCTYEEGRFAARDGIRHWLARDAARGAILKEILEKRYPPAEAGAVYILLWGFRPEDAMNRATSLEIVTWLRSPHLEIRELAYYWVAHLTGRKWEFRAAEVPARRETAIRKIEAHIATAGALIKQSEKDAGPK